MPMQPGPSRGPQATESGAEGGQRAAQRGITADAPAAPEGEAPVERERDAELWEQFEEERCASPKIAAAEGDSLPGPPPPPPRLPPSLQLASTRPAPPVSSEMQAAAAGKVRTAGGHWDAVHAGGGSLESDGLRGRLASAGGHSAAFPSRELLLVAVAHPAQCSCSATTAVCRPGEPALLPEAAPFVQHTIPAAALL